MLLGVAKDSTLKAALFILFLGGFTPKPSVPIGQFLGAPFARPVAHPKFHSWWLREGGGRLSGASY